MRFGGLIQLLIQGEFQALLILAGVLVISITLHEYGHALAADLLGDRTPRLAKRLTINPLAHLDPVGTFAMVFVGFGWGKPVPFNPAGLRSRRWGPALVALAGPAMNLILAIGAAIALGVSPRISALDNFLLVMVFLNLLLAVFNLIPVPPLDGSRLLTILLPQRYQNVIFFLDRYGFLIVVILALWVLPRFLFKFTSAMTDLLLRVFGA